MRLKLDATVIESGEIYTVRYDAVNAMLLNEFLKEHRKVEELASTVAKQQATIAQQRSDFQAKIGELEATIAAQLKEQAEQIQKVSAQIEASRSAPQVACLPAVALYEGGNNP